MRKTAAAGLAIGMIAALGFAAPASAATGTSAQLSVLHGIPDTPVDVYVNGELTLDDFQPGDLAGPLELPAGDYEVALTATDAADASAPVLGPATLTLAAGMNYTAVAHLTAEGQPGLNLFTNDTAATAAGEGRLTVRHVAAAPAVDVLAGGTPVIEDLTNPNEATLNLPASTVSASVALAGETTPVLGPTDVQIQDGVLTILYAWGSAEEGNLAIAAQTVSGLHSNPGGVPSGSAGYLAERDNATALLLMGAAGALAIALAAGTAVAVRARRGAQR
ncbi:DUF4397 domain-containing protein [Microbacterium sp. M3]|uniref:DUF4397 domain-containing protein n=1 Tax=Microbacterium arthrosphaerae TaxID=792652 RepID=A0ABU4GYR9_9MICO|nr:MULTISPECIES: DUF4397 domain-containing protein [Microbacterium]MDW4571604.1 DUF4397 domain-containing protein [Microbacterium arthrosphaerae]MDW7605459.1 DUF4397 domain-containing protein [Microbacterium sp. M3]